jgi:hypothetical protein
MNFRSCTAVNYTVALPAEHYKLCKKSFSAIFKNELVTPRDGSTVTISLNHSRNCPDCCTMRAGIVNSTTRFHQITSDFQTFV